MSECIHICLTELIGKTSAVFKHINKQCYNHGCLDVKSPRASHCDSTKLLASCDMTLGCGRRALAGWLAMI